MQRIAVIGLPGSGKSTFATQLGALLTIPVHHLDKYMFNGSVRIEQKIFVESQMKLLDDPCWIIEGCSITTLELRFARADTVIFLNLSRLLCIGRAFKRLFALKSNDTGCLQGFNRELVKYIWNFNRDKKPFIQELSKKYPHVQCIIFKRAKEVENFLSTL
jgi:adenylate kinase family enzyme